MRFVKSMKTVGALLAAMGAALAGTVAASADSGVATATVVQMEKGTTTPIACPFNPFAPGFLVTGEVFAGAFGRVTGNTPQAHALRGSQIEVAQDAVICVAGAPDAEGDAPFAGVVFGTATIIKGNPEKGELAASYSSPVTGTLNVFTGAISVEWTPNGVYGITGATGRYAGLFIPGGTADVTAESHRGTAPEVGTLDLTFNF